jgi:hypothetical protein
MHTTCPLPLYGGRAPVLDGLPALEDAVGGGGDQSMDTEPLPWRSSARQRTAAQDEPVLSTPRALHLPRLSGRRSPLPQSELASPPMSPPTRPRHKQAARLAAVAPQESIGSRVRH